MHLVGFLSVLLCEVVNLRGLGNGFVFVAEVVTPLRAVGIPVEVFALVFLDVNDELVVVDVCLSVHGDTGLAGVVAGVAEFDAVEGIVVRGVEFDEFLAAGACELPCHDVAVLARTHAEGNVVAHVGLYAVVELAGAVVHLDIGQRIPVVHLVGTVYEGGFVAADALLRAHRHVEDVEDAVVGRFVDDALAHGVGFAQRDVLLNVHHAEGFLLGVEGDVTDGTQFGGDDVAYRTEVVAEGLHFPVLIDRAAGLERIDGQLAEVERFHAEVALEHGFVNLAGGGFFLIHRPFDGEGVGLRPLCPCFGDGHPQPEAHQHQACGHC